MLNSLDKIKQKLKNFFFVLYFGLTGPVKNSFTPHGQLIGVYRKVDDSSHIKVKTTACNETSLNCRHLRYIFHTGR